MIDETSSRFTRVRGVTIHSIEAGQGEPLYLLIHGLGASVLRWIEALPILSSRAHTIAIDLPGSGRSDVPRARYTTAWLAGAVRAFMRERGIDRAIVIGNSLGGNVAIRLAETSPELCRALVLVSPALPRPRGTKVTLKMWARYLVPLVPGLGEAFYEAYLRVPAARRLADSLTGTREPAGASDTTRRLLLQEAADRARRPDMRRAVFSAHRQLARELIVKRSAVWRSAERISVPTLLVWGSRDDVVPLATGRHAASVIAGARLEVIEGAGHVPQLDDPVAFCDIVTRWAAELPPSPSASPVTR